MARYNLPGSVGEFVRAQTFDDRKKQYRSLGINNVLGDFVGSVQQNTALFNKMQKENGSIAPAPSVMTAPAPSVKAPAVSVKPIATPSQSSVLANNSPALSQNYAPIVPQKTINASIMQNGGETIAPKYIQHAGSPDIFDAATGKVLTYEEAKQKGDVFGSDQAGYGGSGLSKNVRIENTPRPEVQSAEQYRQYGGVDIGGQAKEIEDASGGTVGEYDIMDAVNENADVIAARDFADRLKSQNEKSLDSTLGSLGIKEAEQRDILVGKAKSLRDKLLANLESRGLAAGGIREQGEADIEDSLRSGVGWLGRKMDAEELDSRAKALAANEKIDISLAKTIIKAVNAEAKARQTASEKEQDAINEFLKSQGLSMNPLTGEVFEEKATKTTAQSEYEYAQDQGYNGTFLDYQRYKSTQYGTETGTSGKALKLEQALSGVSPAINAIRGTDGYANPNGFRELYMAFVQQNPGMGDEFLKQFPVSMYVNPNDQWMFSK